MDCQTLLNLLPRHRTIAVVGAGGKTSLLFALADAFSKEGKTVCITTTTKMYAVPDTQRYVQRGSVCQEQPEKICALPPQEYEALRRRFDIVLVEADGARHLPMKVPGEHEPVIPPDADLVIGILGASAIGKPLKDVCFRAELAGKILGCGLEHLVTLEDLLFLLQSEQGQRKGVHVDYRMVIGQSDLLPPRQGLPQPFCPWHRP